MQFNAFQFSRVALFSAAALIAMSARVAGQMIEVTPFVGYESSGSFPLEEPASPIQALRANAAQTYGAFVDYRIVQNVQAEFYWVRNATTYSQQSVGTGLYADAYRTAIDQFQFGGLYHLRDRGNRWRPYIAGSIGFTHDGNNGNAPDRTALGFGVGGGITFAATGHLGLRADARWMPTYGSSAPTTTCDYFGDCFPDTYANYLQRINLTIGLIIRP